MELSSSTPELDPTLDPAGERPANGYPAHGPTCFGGFRDLPREHGFEPLAVEGELPAELDGTLYRIGPGLLSAFGERYGHWFDGDGAVYAIRFEAGRAEGAARVVESAGLLEERRRGRRIFGGYGTRTTDVWRQLWDAFVTDDPGKNIANTSVLVWQGRLLALMEGGRPTEIARDDLHIRGETDLEGVVGRSFSAHPHYVPERRAHYNFGTRYGRQAFVDIYELPDQGRARKLAAISLTGASLIHDFVATPKHLVFFAPPLRLQMWRFLFGFGSFSENLAWRPQEGTEVLVVPIDDPERVVRFTTEAFFQWHFGHAHERGGDIVLDLVRYPDFDSNEWLRKIPFGAPKRAMHGALYRAVLEPAASRVRFEERWARACEFPVVAPSSTTGPQRFTYLSAFSSRDASAHGLPDRVAKVDVERGTADELGAEIGRYPSEPVFVPRAHAAAEDDGWLLTLVYDAREHRSFVAVTDARTMGEPVARVWFDHHLPFTFHGRWAPREQRA